MFEKFIILPTKGPTKLKKKHCPPKKEVAPLPGQAYPAPVFVLLNKYLTNVPSPQPPPQKKSRCVTVRLVSKRKPSFRTQLPELTNVRPNSYGPIFLSGLNFHLTTENNTGQYIINL